MPLHAVYEGHIVEDIAHDVRHGDGERHLYDDDVILGDAQRMHVARGQAPSCGQAGYHLRGGPWATRKYICKILAFVIFYTVYCIIKIGDKECVRPYTHIFLSTYHIYLSNLLLILT